MIGMHLDASSVLLSFLFLEISILKIEVLVEKRKTFATEMAYIYMDFTPRGTPIWQTLICTALMMSRETQE